MSHSPANAASAAAPSSSPVRDIDSKDLVFHSKLHTQDQKVGEVIGIYEDRNLRYIEEGRQILEDAVMGFISSEVYEKYTRLPENIRRLVVPIVYQNLHQQIVKKKAEEDDDNNNERYSSSTAITALIWRQGNRLHIDVANVGDSEVYLVTIDKNSNTVTARRLNSILHDLPRGLRLTRSGINMYRVIGMPDHGSASSFADFYSETIDMQLGMEYYVIGACDGVTECIKGLDQQAHNKFIADLFYDEAGEVLSQPVDQLAMSLVTRARDATSAQYTGRDVKSSDDISMAVARADEKLLKESKLHGFVVADGNGEGNPRIFTKNMVSSTITKDFFAEFSRVTQSIAFLHQHYLGHSTFSECKESQGTLIGCLNDLLQVVTPGWNLNPRDTVEAWQAGYYSSDGCFNPMNQRIPDKNTHTVDFAALEKWQICLKRKITIKQYVEEQFKYIVDRYTKRAKEIINSFEKDRKNIDDVIETINANIKKKNYPDQVTITTLKKRVQEMDTYHSQYQSLLEDCVAEFSGVEGWGVDSDWLEKLKQASQEKFLATDLSKLVSKLSDKLSAIEKHPGTIHEQAFKDKYKKRSASWRGSVTFLPFHQEDKIEKGNLATFDAESLIEVLNRALKNAYEQYRDVEVSFWRKKNIIKVVNLINQINHENKRSPHSEECLSNMIGTINDYLINGEGGHYKTSFKSILKTELDRISFLPLADWPKHINKDHKDHKHSINNQKSSRQPG